MTHAVSPEMRATIGTRLKALAREENVTILCAVESGSRAWGFASPDSDYDVRFLYAEPVAWHLTVQPGRDVIERPINAELDISGWNLRKALSLILNSNAVALEWLQSPVVYAEAPGFRTALLEFAEQVLQRRPILWHYRRLAERQAERLTDPTGAIRLKRLFYVVRPVLALRWLRLRPTAAMPPMDMPTLITGADIPAAVAADIDTLLSLKQAAKEMGTTDQTSPSLDALIQSELAAVASELGAQKPMAGRPQQTKADRLLYTWTLASDPTQTETLT